MPRHSRGPLALLVVAIAGCGGAAVPDGVVYVTSGQSDYVIRLQAGSGRVLDSVALDPRPRDIDEPHALAQDPGGAFWYATLSHGEPTLWKFARPGDRLVGRVALAMAGAARIGITPDGAWAFVPDYYRDGDGRATEVAVVRLHDLAVTARLPICAGPHDAEVRPDGRVVAIVCPASDEIVLLDAEALTERRRIAVAPGPDSEAAHPMNVVWAPDGGRLYATLQHASQVVGWDSAGREVVRAPVGPSPTQLAITPDGATLVVANRGGASASIVDVADGRERARVPIEGDHPHGVALSHDGRLAFVTYEGTTRARGGVVAIRVADGTVVWHTTAGSFTLGVMYLAGPE